MKHRSNALYIVLVAVAYVINVVKNFNRTNGLKIVNHAMEMVNTNMKWNGSMSQLCTDVHFVKGMVRLRGKKKRHVEAVRNIIHTNTMKMTKTIIVIIVGVLAIATNGCRYIQLRK